MVLDGLEGSTRYTYRVRCYGTVPDALPIWESPPETFQTMPLAMPDAPLTMCGCPEAYCLT